MKLAPLILVHRYPDQAINLIEALLSRNNYFVFVHVDLKSEDVFERLLTRYGENTRVHLITKRYKVFWGSFGQIQATLALLQEANKIEPDYAFLLSGQDFPIKPLHAFEEFLATNKGTDFITYFPLPDPQWADGGLSRLQYYHFHSQQFPRIVRRINRIIHKLQNIFKYKRAIKSKFFGGSNWFNLSGNSVKLILNTLHNNPHILKRYRFTLCADELFIQSVLLNQKISNTVVADDLRLVDWGSGPEYPKIWRMADWSKLTNTPDKFFARKFDQLVDNEVIIRLKEHVGQ